MLGDRDLNVFITPLPKNKRGKTPHDAPKPHRPNDTANEDADG